MRIRFGLASLALVAASAIGAFCGTSSAAHPGSARAESPRVRFGVVADVQYADKSAPGPRQYRASLAKLASCIAGFNRQRLAFVVNLGDLIDGNGERSSQDLAQAVNVLDQLKAPWRHVVGNHCLEVERPALMKALGLKAPYYAFTEPGWRFVVLDGMDVSVKAAKDSPAGRAAQA